MRVVQWHGWLLEGSGSNVYAAQATASLRRAGHDVLLVCQERHPERFDFLDAHGTVSGSGVSDLRETGVAKTTGRAVLLRPVDIGEVLPVFVVDDYEGFVVKRFVDLTDEELATYVDRNVDALWAAVGWFGVDAAVTGHAVPGAVIGRRALGPRRYVAKIHGSDVEYAIRLDERCRDLAAEGLRDALAVAGGSHDVLERVFQFVPEARPLGRIIPPGVDPRFRPRPRRQALEETAAVLEHDPAPAGGRSRDTQRTVMDALGRRDERVLADLAASYDQEAPDRDAAALLRSLASFEGPVVGFIGKLIPQKGPHLLLQALALLPDRVRGLMVGFGSFREWMQALLAAMDTGDVEAAGWIGETAGIAIELGDEEIRSAAGLAQRVSLTGRLDHRYAPGALAACDVLVVPSILDEAFAMVALEGAATGALPVVARHSGLAEVAADLEKAFELPGAFSFQPGEGAVQRLAQAIDRLLALPAAERKRLRPSVAAYVSDRWSWDLTAELLLRAAAGD